MKLTTCDTLLSHTLDSLLLTSLIPGNLFLLLFFILNKKLHNKTPGSRDVLCESQDSD